MNKERSKMLSYCYNIIFLLPLLCLFFNIQATRSQFLSYYSNSSINKSFVVVVCCYNNIQWVEKNLQSIVTQRYPHWRIIFVDDGSTDGTGEFVRNYIQEKNLQDKITLIINSERARKLANLYRVLYMCNDDEIVILIDGDDFLISNKVFDYINKIYDDPQVWFTYGQYKNEPASEARKWGFTEKGYAAPLDFDTMKKNSYRQNKFVFMHLRTFYAWVFKLVKLEDLIAKTVKGYEGDFYPASNDLAMYLPMAEMVYKHILFIPTVLYVRNLYSDIVGFKVDTLIQKASAREIRTKNPYLPLTTPVFRNLEKHKHDTAALCIFCHKNCVKINQMLANISMHIDSNLESIYVFYDKQNIDPKNIEEIEARYNNVVCIGYNSTSFKKCLTDALSEMKSNYIFLSTDSMIVKDTLAVGHMIYWLERTFAHAFYTDLGMIYYGQKINWIIPIDQEVCAWKFFFGKGMWRNIMSINMTLYRKNFIQSILDTLQFNSVKELEDGINTVTVCPDKIGLCYKQAHVFSSKYR